MRLQDRVNKLAKAIEKATAETKYKRNITKSYVEVWSNAAFAGYLETLDRLSKATFLTDALLNELLSVIAYYFDIAARNKQLEADIKANTENLINSTTKAIRKAETTFKFDWTDQEAINLFSKAQIVFLKNHALDSDLSKEIQTAFLDGRKNLKTGSQISKDLKDKYGTTLDNSFIQKFGETEYFKGVTSHYSTKTQALTNLLNFQRAGATQYIYYARMKETTCKICAGHHGLTYNIEDALKRYDDYFQAAEENNIDAMKNAIPWISKPNKTLKGMTPSLHFKCQCQLRPYRFIPARNEVQAEQFNVNQNLKAELSNNLDDDNNILKKLWALKQKNISISDNFSQVGKLIQPIPLSKISFPTMDKINNPENILKKDIAAMIEAGYPLQQADGNIIYLAKDGYIILIENNEIAAVYTEKYFTDKIKDAVNKIFGD